MYPNPVREGRKVNLSLNKTGEEALVTIANQEGKMVMRRIQCVCLDFILQLFLLDFGECQIPFSIFEIDKIVEGENILFFGIINRHDFLRMHEVHVEQQKYCKHSG